MNDFKLTVPDLYIRILLTKWNPIRKHNQD